MSKAFDGHADGIQGIKAGLRSPSVPKQPSKLSPQAQPKSLWKNGPTMVISPNGRRMPLEEAVTLVSYLSGPEAGTTQQTGIAQICCVSMHELPPSLIKVAAVVTKC